MAAARKSHVKTTLARPEPRAALTAQRPLQASSRDRDPALPGPVHGTRAVHALKWPGAGKFLRI